MNLHDIELKMMRFCAYQERCPADIKKKLSRYTISKQETADIIKRLKAENYIDENRYTSAYVRGKLNQNKWGKKKIEFGLIQKQIPQKIIEKSLDEIPDESYREICQKLAQQKWKSLISVDSEFEKKQKTGAYLMRKGFESDLFWPLIDRLSND